MKYTIGIDLGGTNIAAGLVDGDSRLIVKASVPTRASRPWREIAADMAALAERLAKEAGLPFSAVCSIGVGSPGTPDTKRGIILFSGNLGWDRVPVAQELSRLTGKPVLLANDANCAALAEGKAGAGKGLSSLVLVTFGTGIGAGILLDGRVYEGFNFGAGEFGHMVIRSGGEACTCGRKGCWEAYASMTALCRQAGRAALKNPSSALSRLESSGEGLNGRNVFEAAKAGDETARAVVGRFLQYVSEGVVNVVNILQPQAVLIGGALSKEGDYVLAPLRRYARLNAFCRNNTLPRIGCASLGNDAGILGAALLGR